MRVVLTSYRVTFARSARKELEKLDRQLALRILSASRGILDWASGEGNVRSGAR